MPRQTQPATQWHHFEELCNKRHFGFYEDTPELSDHMLPIEHQDLYFKYEPMMKVVREAAKAPKMVITDDLVKAMGVEAVADSLLAMIDAEVLHMPYKSMLVEGNYLSWKDERVFFYCEEGEFWGTTDDGVTQRYQFRGQMWTLYKGVTHRVVVHPFTTFLAFSRDNNEPIMSIAAPPADWMTDKTKKDIPHLIAQAAEIEAKAALRLLSIAFVVTNIRGIEKEVVEVKPSLNKARAKSGKPAIPKHTVLRIGHVYDKKGNSHSYTAAGHLDGRSSKVYLRRGHTRNQRIGPREEGATKLIYIEPILVNYHPGDDTPAPTTVVKW